MMVFFFLHRNEIYLFKFFFWVSFFSFIKKTEEREGEKELEK